MTRLRFIIIFTALMLLTPLYGAAASYILRGTVYAEDGEPVPYATVSIPAKGINLAASATGEYKIQLEAAKYSVEVSAIGYDPQTLSINLERNSTLDFTLAQTGYRLAGVKVTGKTAGRKVAESAFNVNAVEISADVNRMTTVKDIVDRTSGVKVRREGGVGSDYDLSINGLSGNSIRYFIDGVPLDTKGTGMTLDNVPLNTVERIELYKGVVPSSLGADALGGAVNIITRRKRSNYLDASYGVGSFHTQNADLTGQYFIPRTSIAIRPTISFSKSKNDYKMHDVKVWDEEQDKYIFTDKKRFHDDYQSLFGQLEAGVNDVAWADGFFVQGSYSAVDKDLQTGAMQNRVYGKATRNTRSWSAGARYNKQFGNLNTHLDFSYTHDPSETIDTAYRRYSWDGSWLPASGNELNNGARSIRVYKRPLTVLNAGLSYQINMHHTVAFNYLLNRRSNKRYDEVDKSFEPSNDIVTKQILALTYSNSFLQDKLQNTLFVKDYINTTKIRQTDRATITGSDKIDRDKTKSYYGAGVGTRYMLFTPLAFKGSYEHSVRLPLSRELLGNGTTVYPNLALNPETSNNYNLGIFGTWHIDGNNTLTYEANGYIRHVQNYIRAVVSEREGMMQYVNEPAIDVKGVDFDLAYNLQDRLETSFNISYSDARNLRKYKPDGNPSATYKNRVPNRPWLFANAQASYSWHSLLERTDRLRLGADFQWIHWYYLNWEAYGSKESKAKIPTQCITDVSVSYEWHSSRYNISLDCTNVFDRLAFDNYMLQKPGRAFFAKFRLFLE